MKAKWGIVHPGVDSNLLNLELPKKHLQCLEYVVVHDLATQVKEARGRTRDDRHFRQWPTVERTGAGFAAGG